MIHNNQSMNLPFVRVHLALTQQQLADSLGVSRSLIGMAETSRRSLPAKAIPLLQGMQQIAATMPFRVPGNKRFGYPATRVYKHVERPYRPSRASFVRSNTLTTKPLTQRAGISYTTAQKEVGQYSIQLLKSKADCQELLNRMLPQKEMLRYKLQYLQLEKQAACTRGVELAGQLAMLNIQLDAGQNTIIKYPEASSRKKWEIRNARLYYKKLLLEQQMEGFDAVAMLQRERTINIAEGHFNELDHFIDTVRQRMEQL